jgi:4-hydroxybenzoyl-CoA thioesterase
MTAFVKTERIRFAHCDPAGIVFYPRYFEMINALVEDWFEHALGVSFNELHFTRGIISPTVHIDCTFSHPSRLGEDVTLSLELRELGRSSFKCEVAIRHQQEQRVLAKVVIVFVDREKSRSVPIPDDLRRVMAPLVC